MHHYSPKIARLGNLGGEGLLRGPMATAPVAPAVSIPMVERLLTVLACCGRTADPQRVDHAIAGCTIRQFRQYTELQQLHFIDTIWEASCEPYAFDCVCDNMQDTAVLAGAPAPLPSSMRPTGGGPLAQGVPGPAFQRFGVGFRIEGSSHDDVNRVKAGGMSQQRLSDDFMLNHRGMRVDRTVIRTDPRARIWTGNHDIFNETAVCVSRSLFGAAAFPERNSRGWFYLWAINCRGLRGCDTEARQLHMPHGPWHWRPGEKAYRKIPFFHVLGYVRIQRLSCGPNGGWRFLVPPWASWDENATTPPEDDQRAYMQGELRAWVGQHEISDAYDFAH
ncbi:hypothetical protein [Paludibaculum fermentans]|uniref:hypothetical protein n=1 Tax=Paludibaculum fermentans TaxID=1473598 RepID=UPI003EB8C2BB